MIAELIPTENSVQTFRTPSTLPAKPVDKAACLVYIYPTGPNMGTRYALGTEPAFIGRAEDCAVRNTDASVSRYHAKIALRDDGEYAVTDLGSTNGTFLNNQQKREGVLRDGDYLRIGNCIYRFLGGGNLEAEYHEEIYRLTVLDGLTQVHNRRYLSEFLDRELARAHRYDRPLALALFDIDRFKRINDTHGHLAGDTVLRQLAALLKGVVRKDELLARYGGEEFAIVLPETSVEAGVAAGERLREAVEGHRFEYEGEVIPVTVSVGVAVSSADVAGPTELLDAADQKLYQAKNAGRNRVAY